jgi:hypothetical protein
MPAVRRGPVLAIVLPSLLNPVAIWEIKEYRGVTGGGKTSDDHEHGDRIRLILLQTAL